MRAISAADAISLAVDRTREILFRPFNWATYLKLGLVAILTEGISGNLNSSSHGGKVPEHGSIGSPHLSLPPEWIAAIVAGTIVAIVLGLVVFYLITRLRFAFFHCLIHNTREIRPGWRLYRTQATRFFWMNVVVALCFLLLMALLALPFVAGFWRLFHNIPPGGHPDVLTLIALILPLIPIIFLLVLAGMLSDIVLRDWMLPHYALDGATAGEAWAFVWASFKAEKKQFLVYVVLRVIMPILAVVALFMILIIPGLVIVGSLGMLEYGVHSAFAGTSGASAFFGILVQVFFGVLAFGFVLLLSICLGGPVSTGLREYALVFYGGRYPALGNVLYPPAPIAPAVPPQTA
ncbi:MAG TPA: hypothetical protein VMU48_17975 [Terracidiphilus sp.]|nr:hypothetical protein [Terracidiphilus sp.]